MYVVTMSHAYFSGFHLLGIEDNSGHYEMENGDFTNKKNFISRFLSFQSSCCVAVVLEFLVIYPFYPDSIDMLLLYIQYGQKSCVIISGVFPRKI